MVSELLVLLQVEPQRISWPVWIAAGVVLAAGVSLVIYFLIRMRRSADKEAEEDWYTAKGSLFVEATETAPDIIAEPQSNQADSLRGDAPSPPLPSAVPDSAPGSGLLKEEGGPAEQGTPPIQPVATEEEREPPPGSQPSATTLEEAHASEITFPEADASEEEPAAVQSEALDEDRDESPLGYEVWAELEREQPSSRDAFEPPAVVPIVPARPAFEPPSIDQIVPPQQSGTITSSSIETASVSHHAAGPRLVAGAVREPAPNEGDVGRDDVVRTLTTYGKYIDEDDRSHLGTIFLVIALLVVAGGVLGYVYVPGVRSWFKDLRERARPQAEQASPARPAPIAQILLRRVETTSNQVKVSGAVYNLSNAPLSGLVVEVSLSRADGSPTLQSVPVRPDSLAPFEQGFGSRGEFEFEYSTGQYRAYEINKLLSNGEEVPITKPRPR